MSWTAYGVLTGHVNLWMPSLMMSVCGAWMLIMIAQEQSVAPVEYSRIFGLPIMIAATTILLAITAGPLIFSAVVFVPSAIAQLMQLRTLLRATDISAVSLPFLVMGVTGQLLWFSWGVLADVSNKLVAGSLALLTAANLVGYALRRLAVVRPSAPMIMDPAAVEQPGEAPAVEGLLLPETEGQHPDKHPDEHPDEHPDKSTWVDLDARLAPALAPA
jgi:uncharacterized protein with PQ loop repeat